MSFACLTEELGKSVARVVEFGLIPLASEESNILGNCVLYVSMATTAASASSTTDPIVACLEDNLESDLAWAVASGGILLTGEQDTLLGNCVLSASLVSSATTTVGEVIILPKQWPEIKRNLTRSGEYPHVDQRRE